MMRTRFQLFRNVRHGGPVSRLGLYTMCAVLCTLGSGARLRGEARPASTSPAVTATAVDAHRVVSIGGAVTETIYALGEEKRLVGVDISSIYPEAATKLPQCGYQRLIAAEGVLSLRPDLVFLAGTAGPETALTQIEQGGVKTVRLSEGYTLEGAKDRILEIGRHLGKGEAAKTLADKIDGDLAHKLTVPEGAQKPRVLFVLSRGGGAMMLAGKNTAADAMIELAGGVNLAAADIESYKPTSGESIMAYDPQVVVTTSRTFAEVGEGGMKELCPGIVVGEGEGARHLVVMDDLYLLGFGPRVGEAVAELSWRLQGKKPEVAAGGEKP